MSNNHSALLMLSLVLATGNACSLKEKRTECPCYVSVKADAESDCIVSFFSGDASLLERKTMTAEELTTGDNYTKIRKGTFYVSVLEGLGSMELTGGRNVSCLPGRESDKVFCGVEKAFAAENDDDLVIETILEKQYANVEVTFLNTKEETYPYDIRVSAGYSGFDLLTLKSITGDYHLDPSIDSDFRASFRMTRQNNSEPIYIYFLDKMTGAVVADLDLQSYIAATGYNWDAEYLSDISIVIDFARMNITINLKDWDVVFTFEFII